MPRGEPWTVNGANLDGVDPRLLDVIGKTADQSPYKVQITSAHNARFKLDEFGRKIPTTKWHPGGIAVDIRLQDPETGRFLHNFQNIQDFPAHEGFAQLARDIQQRDYPELADKFRWGGYFGGALRNPFNPGGYAVDSMHFDLGPTNAMAGGSWDGGLTEDQKALMPGVKSVGMKDRKHPKDMSDDELLSFMGGSTKAPAVAPASGFVTAAGSPDVRAPTPGSPAPEAGDGGVGGTGDTLGKAAAIYRDALATVGQRDGYQSPAAVESMMLDNYGPGWKTAVTGAKPMDAPASVPRAAPQAPAALVSAPDLVPPRDEVPSAPGGSANGKPSLISTPAPDQPSGDVATPPGVMRVSVRPTAAAAQPTAGSTDPTKMSDADLADFISGKAPVPSAGATGQPSTGQPGSSRPPGMIVDEPGPFRQLAGAYGRAALNGLPIIGPRVQDLAERAAAGVNSLVHGTPYEEELSRNRLLSNKLTGLNPAYANEVGGVIGGVVGTVPIAATGPGATALGLTGSLGTRMIAGAAGNALLSGADAYSRGEDVGTAGKWGAALGVGIPVAGRAIGAVASSPVGQAVLSPINKLTGAIANQFSGTARATNALTGAVDNSGMTLDQLRGEVQRNPSLSLADLSPALREQLVGLGQGGPQASPIAGWVADRRAAAPQAVSSAFDTSLGGTPDPTMLRDLIANVAAGNARNGFGQALKGAKPVDLSGTLSNIDSRVYPGVSGIASPGSDIPLGPIENELLRVRGRMATGSDQLIDPTRVHDLQSEIGQRVRALQSSPDPEQRRLAGALGSVRGDLNQALDTSTGGLHGKARAQYADDMSVRDAFDQGMDFRRVRSGSAGIDDRPETLRRQWATMSAPEQDAYRQGMRVEIDRVLNSTRNPLLAGEGVGNGFNRDKLEIAFGKPETDRLMTALDDTRRIADTNNRLTGGSDTAQRTAARESVAVRGAKAAGSAFPGATVATIAGGLPGGAAALGVKAAGTGVSMLQRRADLSRNRLLSNALMSSGPEAEEVLNRLGSRWEEQAAPTWLPRAANDPGVNLLVQSVGRRSSSR